MSRPRWQLLADVSGHALLLSWALCFVFALWLTYGRPLNNFEPAKLDKLLDGGANRPFASRVLVPWVARAVVAPFPAEARRASAERLAAEHPGLAHALELFAGRPATAAELAVLICVDGLAFALFLFLLARLFRSLYVSSEWVARCAPPMALLVLPLFFRQGDHLFYDPLTLVFATWFLLAMGEVRIRTLYALLFVGTLNKETMLLALLAFLLPRFRAALGARWRVHLAGLAATGAASRLLALLASTPLAEAGPRNSFIRDYFFENALELARHPPMVDASRLAALILFVLLVAGGLRRKPQLLRSVLPVALPFLALSLVGSLWGEIRSLYELYPIVFLMGYQTSVEWIGLDLRAADGATPSASEPCAWRWVPAASAAVAGAFLLVSGLQIVRVVIFGLMPLRS